MDRIVKLVTVLHGRLYQPKRRRRSEHGPGSRGARYGSVPRLRGHVAHSGRLQLD